VKEVYQTEEGTNVVEDTLEEIVREGARRMLAAGLENEVSKFLGRERYERGGEFRGYRNGYHPSRELTVGVSAVEVKVPRVSDVPAEVSANGFESKIVSVLEVKPIQPDKMGTRSRTVSPREFLDALLR